MVVNDFYVHYHCQLSHGIELVRVRMFQANDIEKSSVRNRMTCSMVTVKALGVGRRVDLRGIYL